MTQTYWHQICLLNDPSSQNMLRFKRYECRNFRTWVVNLLKLFQLPKHFFVAFEKNASGVKIQMKAVQTQNKYVGDDYTQILE